MDTFIISRDAYEFDGHMVHSVTDRSTRKLIGHVALIAHCWAFLPVTAERGHWLTSGRTMTMAGAAATLVNYELADK